MDEITGKQVLIVENPVMEKSAVMGSAILALKHELEARNIRVLLVRNYEEARPVVLNNMDLDAILAAADMDPELPRMRSVYPLLEAIRARQPEVPVFLLADRAFATGGLSAAIMEDAREYVWIFEDSPVFIAGRIESAIARFRRRLLPPLMRAIWEYNESNHEYSWAAPGHQGGKGFTKTPAGKKFYDFYGENLFRTDTGIERTSIGSLLDHSGAFQKSEQEAAAVFGAQESYSVICGTSGSNRTIMQMCLPPGAIAVCDRNCHKSIEQGLILTGAVPVYLRPTRNRYGIIGPILPQEMNAESIARKIKDTPLAHSGELRSYAVVTNCTYDGICYNAAKVENLLAPSTDRIHFDEAWYAYARFNPVYHEHFAMRDDPAKHKGATVFATHSTHKLLSALSQASYIHVRQGRRPIGFDRMNQSYMMHTTTSPLYAICASNDIATRMMKESGFELTQEVIDEAVDFRQALARLSREFQREGEWFFQIWNAPRVKDPVTKKEYDFADAPREVLTRHQEPWRLEPGENWHGFVGLPENYVMLDPIKVSILCPGMGDDGGLLKLGVPAMLVSSFLYRAGIVPTRTTDFQLMFLFSMGITRGKWMTLLNTLLNFKSSYDRNDPVAEVLPELAEAYPRQYGRMGIRELGDRMFRYVRENTPEKQLDAAFAHLPEQAMSPREAFLEIVRDNVEFVPAGALSGRIAANAVIPYPPGIPMMLSGERFGSGDSPQIGYLKALAKWDADFPGFEHETEGCKVIDGIYHVMCVKK